MVSNAQPLKKTAAATPMLVPRRRHTFGWTNVRRHPRFLVGGTVVLLLVLAALFAPVLVRDDPRVSHPADANDPPSVAHIFGTDDLGRDMLGRVIYGSRTSLSVGVIAVSIGLTIGVTLGLIAGWYGGKTDLFVMRGIDALLAFPGVLLAIAITAALGATLQNAMIAIGVVAIPVYTRVTRGQVLQMREREYIEAARTMGARDGRIVFRHILPNILSPLIVQASLSIAFAILAEASLSFLGLGAQPPTPTWGSDINHAKGYLANGFWWQSVAPGVAIMVTVLAFNLLGDSIRDLLDPRLRDK